MADRDDRIARDQAGRDQAGRDQAGRDQAGREGIAHASRQALGPRQRRSSFFATCPAGLGKILRDELVALPGVEARDRGSDGQADYVLFDADRQGRTHAVACRLAENVFADAGRATRGGISDPPRLAARCWQPEPVQRALSIWAEQVRPLSTGMTFGVRTRLQTGPRSLRAGARAALAEVIVGGRPRWRQADPAQLEIWLSEWRDGELVLGLRLGGNRPARPGRPQPDRTHGRGSGFAEAAALAPAVAAAMVHLAGEPSGLLLDPCCGSGSILAQALASGWTAAGTDIDATSLSAAARVAPGASVTQGDAREILEPDDCVGACVSWISPERAGGPGAGWLAAALAEMSRVTRGGGAVVLLTADVPRAAIPGALRLRLQVPVRLPGGRETIWVFRRA